MTAEEYLSQYKDLGDQITKKIEKMRQEWDKALSITPQQSDGCHSGGVSDKVGNAAQRRIDLNCEINELIDSRYDLSRIIINQLRNLDNEQYGRLLFFRYIKLCRWEIISIKLHKPTDYVRCTLHGRALKSFSTTYGIDY